VLHEASGRIAAMAAAQRVLYGTTDATQFDARKFLGAVVETIQQTLPPEVRIEVSGACGVLSNEMAMPIALILNELLTNSAKHGTKDPKGNAISVSLTDYDGQFELTVEDGGPGFDLEAVRGTSSGLRLVLGLARQLHADFQVTQAPSRVRLRFATRGA
jgi:two-component sensor histidine kinase